MDLAICVPLGSTLELTKTRSAESLAAFKATVDTSVYFHDKDHGLLWLRVVGEYARKQEDYQPCGKDKNGCFTETIKFLTLGSRWTWEEIGGSQRGGNGSTLGSDLSTDCRSRPGLLEAVSKSSVHKRNATFANKF